MKFMHRPAHDRIQKQDDWKKSAYAFVPFQTNFGELCGFADDVVNAAKGFGMHPHENMEITTIVLRGKQAHKDNTGSQGELDANSIQTMSAGTGIMHSEYNASETTSFHSFQIWVYPKTMNVKPRYGKFTFLPHEKVNKVLLAISPNGNANSTTINQDAFFSVCQLEAGREINYKMNLDNNGVYIHCAEGNIEIDTYNLLSGDALGVYDAQSVVIKASQTSELIFVEVPMTKGIKL
ncbi:MAG: pirin family protein [Bacteroidia bacterium]|nr:pirin family protein [Bacteroidia bacterium]